MSESICSLKFEFGGDLMDKDNNRIRNLLNFLNTTRDNAYWYPLTRLKIDIPIVSYNVDKIYKDEQIVVIRHLLENCKIDSVIMIQMDHGLVVENENMIELLYASDDAGYDFPWYVETYYYDSSEKWMIYVSHEGTITFAGEEIVAFAKKILPSEYLYGMG